MKKILYLLSIMFFLSCSNNQKKAEHEICKSIKSQMPEGWTYTPIKFSKLADVLSNINEDEKYKELKEKYDKIEYQYLYDSISSAENYKVDSITYGKDFADKIKIKPSPYERDLLARKINDLEVKYTPYKIGTGIIHTYICKTNFGDSLYFSKYVFDDDFKIKKIYNNSISIDSDSVNNIIDEVRKSEDFDINKDHDYLWYYVNN